MHRLIPALACVLLLASPARGQGLPNQTPFGNLPSFQPNAPAPVPQAPETPFGGGGKPQPYGQAPSPPYAGGTPSYPTPNMPPMPQPGPFQGSPAAPTMPPSPPQQVGPGGRPNLADELTDFGVPPQERLNPNVGSPTPTSIPGGHVITTSEVLQAVRNGGGGLVLIDVLEGGSPHPTIPGAVLMPGAGRAGMFDDPVQGQLRNALLQVTQGQQQRPLVFFCLSSRCWESYNAALRAVHLGFTTVLWYRGGLEAWRAANLPLGQPAGAAPPRRE